MSFSHGNRIRPSTERAGSEFKEKAKPFGLCLPDWSLYPTRNLQAVWAWTHFGRNQLPPSLIGLLPLGPNQRNELHVRTPADLHQAFARLHPAQA